MPPPPQHRISATVTWHNYVSLFVHREPQRSVAAFRRLSASSPASSSIELASSKAQERRFGHLHSIKSPLTNEGIPTRCRKKQYYSSKGAWFVNKTGATRNWGLEQVDQRRSGHKFEKINKDFTLACPAPNPSLIISISMLTSSCGLFSTPLLTPLLPPLRAGSHISLLILSRISALACPLVLLRQLLLPFIHSTGA